MRVSLPESSRLEMARLNEVLLKLTPPPAYGRTHTLVLTASGREYTTLGANCSDVT